MNRKIFRYTFIIHMFTKTITTDFFTTIDGNICINTLDTLTYRLPALRTGWSITAFERELLEYLETPDSEILSFYRWSEALYHALEIIWIEKKDEIILQWYTCSVVSNAVKQSWAKLVYSDIDESTLWFDLEILKKNITKKTKVILVQHTFGKPIDMNAIVKIAKEKNIIVIEDCAHSLWSKISDKQTWTYGDFAIFSTGRDKVISSVTGWFLVINNPEYFDKANRMRDLLDMPSRVLTLRNLAYNILWYIAYKTYDIAKLWRVIMMLSRKMKLITEILSKEEKACQRKKFWTAFPNSLAYLWRKELAKIQSYITHRKNLWELYDMHINTEVWKKVFTEESNEYLNWFRYPFILKSRKIQKEFVKYMKSHNILVWTSWSGSNIAPKSIKLKDAMYKKWSCKISEDIARRIVFLPNHMWISTEEVIKISQLINKFESKYA